MASANEAHLAAHEDAASPEAPPRPHAPEDIVRLMAEAEQRHRERLSAREARREPAASVSFTQKASGALLWGGLGAALLAAALAAYAAAGAIGAAIALAAGAAGLAALALAGGALAASRSARRRRFAGSGELAGADMLAALGVAEKVLDADPDARLLTRRDGVVAFANRAYAGLAREAGLMAESGLPPRFDRLFAQQGGEATKVFRLCRAAKSAAPAEEILCQIMGSGGGRRRRFEVSVRPIDGAGDHVAWRLRELPAEEDERDALASAFADYVRPVFALEKSGQIAWANAAMRARLGADRGALMTIDDAVLGETAGLVRALWRIDQTPQKAQLRTPAGPVEGAFTAFRRGGVGEGFVCVELALEEQSEGDEAGELSADLAEAPFGVAIVEGEIGRDARIVAANRAFGEAFGAARKNAPLARALSSDAIDEIAAEIRRKQASGAAPRAVEARIGDGASARVFAVHARPVRRRRGGYGVRRTLLFCVDATERKRAEEEGAQEHKLVAIGRLAGEVAHDFNNLLQVVLGNCERLMLRHPAGDPAYRDLVLIRENAQRAANMTKQLLAFSRKQTLQREVFSITEILRDFSRFLDRALGETVDLDLVNGRNLPLVKVDRNQLESAIMNLVVNARDAMAPEGGRVTITTSRVAAEDAQALNLPGLVDQDFLLIEVADTGPGVPGEIKDLIFEPFFTTKDVGKGTGLGLSTVYGIIGQMDGAITVDDAPGGGAAFRIYLPAHQGEIEAASEPAAVGPADLTGAGRILVVEDEDAVRTFVVTALEDCGYEVTAVADGEEALELLAEDAAFDLVITDVMMPVVDGPTLIRRARAERGLGARVIFMSAYAENSVRDQLAATGDAAYIQKPFPLKALAAKVKQTLAAPPAEAA